MPDGPTMGPLSIPGVEGCTTSGTSPALTVSPRDNLNLDNLNEEADGVRIISRVKKLSLLTTAIETFDSCGPSDQMLDANIYGRMTARMGDVRAGSFLRQRLDIAI
jgi:hypothetical protein